MTLAAGTKVGPYEIVAPMAYVYSYNRILSDLYLADGLK